MNFACLWREFECVRDVPSIAASVSASAAAVVAWVISAERRSAKCNTPMHKNAIFQNANIFF